MVGAETGNFRSLPVTKSRSKSAAADVRDLQRSLIDEDAGSGLFSSGGAFEAFPGAVLVAGLNGVVLGANAAAQPIADFLQADEAQTLRAAIASALVGKAAQINPLLVPDRRILEKGPRAFDTAVLPWGDGMAALLLGRDVTVERGLRSSLIQSRQRFKDLVELAGDFAWETDQSGRFTFANAEDTLGYDAGDLLGKDSQAFLLATRVATPSPFATKVPLLNGKLRLRRADGGTALLTVKALPVLDGDGVWCGARGLCRPISQA